MKHILVPILLLVFLFPSLELSEELTIYDFVVTDGLIYKKFSDVPFSGTLAGEWQGKIVNGKEEGPWVRYSDHGQLRFKGHYKNGKEHGTFVSYYPNGELEMEGEFENGKGWMSWYCIGPEVSEEVTLDDLVEREDLIYETSTDGPVTDR